MAMRSTATNSSAAHKSNLRGHNVLPPPSSNNILSIVLLLSCFRFFLLALPLLVKAQQ
jgi:hypothetical protein